MGDVHKEMAERLRSAKTQSEIDQTGIDFYGYMADSVLAPKDFAGCDKMLSSLVISKTDLTLLVSVLVSTCWLPREMLPSRQRVFQRVWNMYKRERGYAECYFTLFNLA